MTERDRLILEKVLGSYLMTGNMKMTLLSGLRKSRSPLLSISALKALK